MWLYKYFPKVGQMCSITNTAHPRKNNTPLCANALTSSDFFSVVSCCHVYLLSCLYVIGRHSLVLTDPKQKGACNQGKGRLRVIKYQFTRRHSFCNFYQECTLTRFSRNRQKKTSSSDKVSFISPIRYPDRFGF